MSKVGRDRKGLAWNSTTKRKFPWEPLKATHREVYVPFVHKSRAGVAYTNYKRFIVAIEAQIATKSADLAHVPA